MKTDPNRKYYIRTGIAIRAFDPRSERWGTWDVAHLDKESLIEWLKDRDSDYLKDVIGIILDHGHLRDLD